MTAPPMDIVDPPRVALDIFPATISGSLPGDSTLTGWGNVRVVVTAPDEQRLARLMVWMRPGEPVMDVELDLDASRPAADLFATMTGEVFAVTRSGGCGCGNPLRGWQPFVPYLMGSLT